jgi:hypothetical protein
VTPVKATALNCPNCGAALTLHGFGHTLTIVCPQCQSVLDAKDPLFQILQKSQARASKKMWIPLGARGRVHGQPYQAIGFQQRTITVDGIDYSWSEYLLFNPYRGFLYLTEYKGHWNLAQTLRSLPKQDPASRRPSAQLGGRRYAHFQTAEARTSYAAGEFPWRVQIGDTATVTDFIAPPYLLSSEKSGDDQTWSLSEYVTGRDVWKMFNLPGSPPRAEGVFANQPSPYGERPQQMWRAFAYLLLALIALVIAIGILARDEVVFRQQYSFRPGAGPFVTESFAIEGRPSNVEVGLRTDLNNNWAVFSLALINEQTGEAYDFGREVSYYSGRDSDGDWTEGDRNESVTLWPVPEGRYYLRVEADTDGNAPPVNYEIVVKRDVPVGWLYAAAALLLLAPPAVSSIGALSFRRRRWQESDYGS